MSDPEPAGLNEKRIAEARRCARTGEPHSRPQKTAPPDSRSGQLSGEERRRHGICRLRRPRAHYPLPPGPEQEADQEINWNIDPESAEPGPVRREILQVKTQGNGQDLAGMLEEGTQRVQVGRQRLTDSKRVQGLYD